MEILSSSPLDGNMGEGVWYEREAQWMTEQQWLDAVNFQIWMEDNFLIGHPNRFNVACCQVADPSGVPFPLPSNATQEQMAIYAYTSTLLGVKTNQNYLALFGDSIFMAQVVQPLRVDVGTPTNDYYLIAGTHVYSRDFTNVKVLVNPTAQSYTINLSGQYQTLGGQIVSSINVGSHTGILLKPLSG
jgi:hypothetical protein